MHTARAGAVGLGSALAISIGLALGVAAPAGADPVCVAGECVSATAGPGSGDLTIAGIDVASYSLVNNGQRGQNATVTLAGAASAQEYEIPGTVGVGVAGAGHSAGASVFGADNAGAYIDDTRVSLGGVICQLTC